MSKHGKRLIFIRIFISLNIIMTVYISDAEIQKDRIVLAQKSYRTTVPEIESPKPDVVRGEEARTERMIETGQIVKPSLAAKPIKGELVSTTKTTTLVGTKLTKIYYTVAINDKLYISVWRVPDLSLEFIVGPDGKISYPLIGDIDAAGKTLSELDAEITEKLKEYVNDPQVSVIVREFAGDKVTVIGEVASPGIYKFVGKTNIIDVIATAHGFTNRAKVVGVMIVRQPEDPEKDMELIYVNAKNILKGNLRSTEVKPNDIIYVSRTFISNLQEFYTGWIVPLIGTGIDVETWRNLYRRRIKKLDERE